MSNEQIKVYNNLPCDFSTSTSKNIFCFPSILHIILVFCKKNDSSNIFYVINVFFRKRKLIFASFPFETYFMTPSLLVYKNDQRNGPISITLKYKITRKHFHV